MRLIFLFLVFISGYIFAQDANNLLDLINHNNISITSEICNRSEEIEGKFYCVQVSKVTLNACGKRSDWPCLDIDGCLVIDKYVLND
jgi:hypothetical protein